MPYEKPLAWVPNLEDAIQRHPLTVQPETSLLEAIALISQAHHHTCLLTEGPASLNGFGKAVRASCVLVTQENAILGILTERDVVRLTAQALELQAVKVSDVMVHPVVTLPERSVQDIFAVLFLFRRYRIRHVPIVNEQDHLVGVISHESVRQVLRPANLLRFRRVSDVMTVDVIQAPLTATVLHLAQLMATHRVSCVVITQLDGEENEQPVGIATERDIVQFQALQLDLGKTAAQQVMSSPLFLLNPQDSLWTAHQEMQKRRVGRLVVSWNWGKGLGLVTQTSLLRVFDPMEMYGVIENLQQTLQQLEVKPPEPLPPTGALPLAFQSTLAPQSTTSDSASATSNTDARSQPTGSDREENTPSIADIYTMVKTIVHDRELSLEQVRSQLQSVLNTLAQL
ncbi:MAG: CBS domain-containing protein [Leptolyngbya sp. SIO1E4]|nr:CBS domain-containing protein [Leptolyngbya sp. SIO1E4]